MDFLRLFRRRDFARSDSPMPQQRYQQAISRAVHASTPARSEVSVDVPHGLVRDDDFRPVFRLLRHRQQLARHHVDGLVALSLLRAFPQHHISLSGAAELAYLECFPHAQDNPQPGLQRGFRLARNELAQPCSPR